MLKWEKSKLEREWIYHPDIYTAGTPFATHYSVSWEHPGTHELKCDDDGYFNTDEILAKFGNPEPGTGPHWLAAHCQGEYLETEEALGVDFTLEQAFLACEKDFAKRAAACTVDAPPPVTLRIVPKSA